MARLGELLVAGGLLTIEQVEQALRAQVMWGGRLGTNLIELGYLDLDALSKALGRQHRMPPALARHFDKANRELQQQLSPDVAEKLSCVPLRRIGPRKVIAVASVAPLAPREHAIVAAELRVGPDEMICAVAAELRIRYHLERVYKIPRATRFLRSRGNTIPQFPQFEIVPVPHDSDPDLVLPTDTQELPIVRPPPEPVAEAPAVPPAQEPDDVNPLMFEDTGIGIPVPDEVAGRERRRYVRTITDRPSTDSERTAVGRIAIRKMTMPIEPGTGATLGEATRAIRRSTDRDRVAGLVIDALDRFVPACEAAILFVVRGTLAIGWKGFNRNGSAMPEISVPLDQPGLLPIAIEQGVSMRAPASELGELDQLVLASLRHDGADLVIEPVTIAGQVMCLIAMVTARDGQVASAESIAAAAGAGFARLMRDASR